LYASSNLYNALGEPSPGKVCHRAVADIEVEQGNHLARRNDHSVVAELAPITIPHFPIRPYRQFANKIIKGGAAYGRNTYLPQGIGSTWRHLHEVWQRGELEAYYQRSIVDDAAIARGLTEGRFVLDERLKMALSRPRHRVARYG
jgi:hypothetical protein